MAEYIEKRLAKIAIRDLPAELDALAVQRSIEAVGRVPAADVAPVVHGRWITRDIVTVSQRNRAIKSRLFICSCCKRSNGRSPKPYCPNCGAKMDLE